MYRKKITRSLKQEVGIKNHKFNINLNEESGIYKRLHKSHIITII